MVHSKEENEMAKTVPEETLVWGIPDKELNTNVLNMLKDLKKKKKNLKPKGNQKTDTSTKWEYQQKPDIVKWNQKSILELQNTINELKN